MALLVISNHLHPLDSLLQKNVYLYNLHMFIIQLAVPFFFITTGFFIGKKIKNIHEISIIEYDVIKKAMIKALKLYLIFTIVYLPLTIYGFVQSGESLLKCIFSFIRGVLFVGENYNSWILWYLLSEIYGLLFIYLLKNKTNNCRKLIAFGFILFLFGTVINLLGKTAIQLVAIDKIISIIKIMIPNGRIFYSFIFIPIGMFISKNEKIKKIIYILLVLLILSLSCFINNILVNNISLLICSYLIFKLVINKNIKKISKSFTNYCKLASQDLYFFHLYIWSFLMLCIDGSISNNYSVKYYVLTVIILFIFSFIHLIVKTKIAKDK